ncbi:MAG: TetR/AcrR family transcriptional regulator [Paracoccus sp.]|jgi:AcrR family transcriptional regulator|nr:TetR/AcrR family transcriptional regulator [Paracoccus sp. (in: a-proteobacteria)]
MTDIDSSDQPLPDGSEIRRRPQQSRSRQKVEAILDATAALIGEKGVDSVTMRDIARTINAPLSVIYQYFPNKSAIVETLYARFTEQIRAETVQTVTDIRTPAEFLDALDNLLEHYYISMRAHPLAADVVSAILADNKLRHLDIEDSRQQADVMSAAGLKFVSVDKRDEFERLMFLFNHLVGGLMRLLLDSDDGNARVILDDYKRIARQQLQSFFG